MDLAYDHIVEESLPKEDDGKKEGGTTTETQNSLNAEIQDAYKAFSASPWGAKIGGFFGTVVKQVGRVPTPQCIFPHQKDGTPRWDKGSEENVDDGALTMLRARRADLSIKKPPKS